MPSQRSSNGDNFPVAEAEPSGKKAQPGKTPAEFEDLYETCKIKNQTAGLAGHMQYASRKGLYRRHSALALQISIGAL